MRKTLLSTCLFAVTATALAGCVDPGVSGSGDWTREIVMSIDDDDLLDAQMASATARHLVSQVALTTLVYTQASGDLDVADATVHYTSSDGAPRTAPLSDFTQQKTLAPGDSVRIPSAAPWSGAELRSGPKAVATRPVVDQHWLRVGGAPIPLAADIGGAATYTVDLSGSLVVGFDRFAMHDDSSDCRYEEDPDAPGEWGYQCETSRSTTTVSDATLDAGFSLTGQVRIRAEPAGERRLVSIMTTTQGGLDLTAEATFTEDADGHAHHETDGIQIALDLDTASGVDLMVDATDAIRTVSAFNKGSVDGHVWIWNDTIARSEKHSPEGLELPASWDERIGPEPVTAQATGIATTLLEDAWSMGFVPGDTVDMHFEIFGMTLDQKIRAASYVDVDVAGQTRRALRIIGESSADLDGLRIDAQSFEYNLDAETMLPLRFSAEGAHRLDGQDIARFVDLIRNLSGTEIDGPEGFALVVTSNIDIELAELRDGVAFAAPLLVFGSAAALMTLGGGMNAALA